MLNRRELDIVFLQSQCLLLCSRKLHITFKECSELFCRYNIFEYISVCYESLHLIGVDCVANEIVKRIRKGVIFATRTNQ